MKIPAQLFVLACLSAAVGATGAQEASQATAAAVPDKPAKPAKPGAAPSGTPSRPSRAKAPERAAQDRLELDATAVTGSRELPKVLAIVPWKKADLGDLLGKPLNSLVDDALQPLDREVFRREIDYHSALAPERGGASGPAGPDAAEPH